MPSATQRKYAISFLAGVTVTDDYGTHEDFSSPTTLATVRASVRFGTAQEKREAAQEAASQTASFECVRSSTLNAIPMTARIGFDGSQWDLTERSPLDRATIRFTGVRRA